MHIDWRLISDKEIVIDRPNVLVEINDKKIIYKDEYGIHTIDQKDKIYKRVYNGDTIIIDFNKNLMTVYFEDKKFDLDIKSKYQEKGKEIHLKYSLGEEEKEIIITRKEELWKR